MALWMPIPSVFLRLRTLVFLILPAGAFPNEFSWKVGGIADGNPLEVLHCHRRHRKHRGEPQYPRAPCRRSL